MPKLIVYLEAGMGGQRAWVNSDVKFDDMVLELSYSSSLGIEGEPDSILDGPYAFDQWTMPTEKVEERIERVRSDERVRQQKRAWRDGENDTEEVPCDHPCDTCMSLTERPIRDSEDRVWTTDSDGQAVQMCEACGTPMKDYEDGQGFCCPKCGTDDGSGSYDGPGRGLRMAELFAGTKSIGGVAEARGWNVWSTDLYEFEGMDAVADILTLDPAAVPWTPDFIWASPPCTYFSVASIGKHWSPNVPTDEYPVPHTPKTEEALLGVKIVEATFAFIDYWLKRNPKLLWAIENPMGKLRKLPVVERAPYRTSITYCAYGDTRRKPTDIWSNFPWAARPMCKNGDPCHVAAPRGSRTPGSTQGRKTVDRSRLPEQLCREIVEAVEAEVKT